MKAERQAKILDLIVKKEIGTQEELTMELERAGFVATQATVSRDIREMKLTKVAMSDGKLRYVAYRKTEDGGKIYPHFPGWICVYGQRTEHSCHQDRFRDGDGSGSSTRSYGIAGDRGKYRRG